MDKSYTRDEVIKQNMIDLVTEHKKKCDGATCNISIFYVAELMKRAGIALTPEEKANFI